MKTSLLKLVCLVTFFSLSLNGKAATLTDNFDSGISAGRWEVFHTDAVDAPWSVEAPSNDGMLRISKPADNDSSTLYQHIWAGVRSTFSLDGNFSAFVDFDLHYFPTLPQFASCSEAVFAVSTENGPDILMLRYTEQNTQMAEGYSDLSGPLGWTHDNTEQGKFGISRSGNTMSVWLDRGDGPVLFGSLSSDQFLGPVKLELSARNIVELPGVARPTTALDIRFDNLTITADTIVPEPLTVGLLSLGSLVLLRRKA
jgi:hypothetical protein